MANEITLSLAQQRAVFSARGATLRRYHLGDWPVVWGFGETEPQRAGQGDVLMPFPSRLAHGRYAFAGQTHQMEINDVESPHAIHGFLRAREWQVLESSSQSVRFFTGVRRDQVKGYPFDLDVGVTYALSGDGLRTSFEVRNVGADPAPFGAGFHPYFTFGDSTVDDVELTLPAARRLEFADFLPTGRMLDVTDTDFDFRRARAIGTARLGACYTELRRGGNGVAHVRLARAGRRITLNLDAAFSHVVVYTGDAIPAPFARRALAVEPLTCGTDAFNRPEWGSTVLGPGQIFRGSYEISPAQ